MKWAADRILLALLKEFKGRGTDSQVMILNNKNNNNSNHKTIIF